MRCVSHVLDDLDSRVRHRGFEGRSNTTKLVVLLTDDEQYRPLKSTESFVKWLLGARSHSAQTSRETLRSIAKSQRPRPREGIRTQTCLTREDRQRHPMVDEGLDALAFDPVCELFIQGNAFGPKRRVRDSRGRTDQNQTRE